MTTMPVAEFTSELSRLMRKRKAEGLSASEAKHLQAMQCSLRHHGGPAGSPEEKRQFLRIEVHAGMDLALEADGVNIDSARCLEFGIGGVFAHLQPPLTVGTVVRIAALSVDSTTLQLDIRARVVRMGRAYDHDGVGLEFIDLDEQALARIQASFDALFERAATQPGIDCRRAGRTPAIAQQSTLASICKTLLERGGLPALWTSDGPSTRCRALLSANGRPLRVEQRVLLLFVWRLWTGVCDLRSTEFWHLEPMAQHLVTDLMVAVGRDAGALNDWLARHATPAPREPSA